MIDRSPARVTAAWTRVDTVALVAIVIGAALMRFVSLGRPVELVFDEIFYARDACWYVFGSESCVWHQRSRKPRTSAAGQVADRLRYRRLRLRAVRVARGGRGCRNPQRRPRLPPGLAAAARRRTRPWCDGRGHHRIGAAGGRLPPPRALAGWHARRVHRPVRHRRRDLRSPRPGPRPGATEAPVVVAPRRSAGRGSCLPARAWVQQRQRSGRAPTSRRP